MKLSEVISLTGLVMLVVSCSVKEDRDMCPCRLVLDMTDVDTLVVKYAEIVATASDGYGMRDTLEVGDFDEGYMLEVPRGDVGVGVYFGACGSVDDRGSLEIGYGNECPPVYMHSSNVVADGELVVENVAMRKNHCIMTIQVQAEKEFPFRLEAKGGVDGYEPGGKPSVGDFMYAMDVDPDGPCRLVLPRQTDNSLVLEVHDDSHALKTFALGEYVAASGYDWSEDDLRDIAITLDYSLTRVVISVEDWDHEHVFNVVI